MVQKEGSMIVVSTEHDLMLEDIADFTNTIVRVAGMKNVPVSVQAEIIHNVELIFHKFIMDKIVTKCVDKSIPSNN
jgi:hypothetical protein